MSEVPGRMEQQTILIIDDRLDTYKAVKSSLVDDGYDVIVATSVVAGLEHIALEKPDLLILGLDLSDAFELMHRAQSDSSIPRLPVITILRSWGQEADIRKGWDLGVDTFLPAAFNPLELRAVVKRIFKSIKEDREDGE